MQIAINNKFMIEVGQTRGLGSAWIVKLYRKRFFFKRVISTDWFLDGDQAKRFADQIARQIGDDGTTKLVQERKPGWTLRRAPH